MKEYELRNKLSEMREKIEMACSAFQAHQVALELMLRRVRSIDERLDLYLARQSRLQEIRRRKRGRK